MADSVDARGLPVWPAPERNKQPIAQVLEKFLAERSGVFLEVASATGQHLEYFASRFDNFTFVPSDVDPSHLEALRRLVDVTEQPNIAPPVPLDAAAEDWPIEHADVIYNANMIHIARWEVAVGLFRGAGHVLEVGGLLVTYGPYKVAGRHTSESNERFDDSLRGRNAEWGVRDIDDLRALAEARQLELIEQIAMPANNFTLVWEKRASPVA